MMIINSYSFPVKLQPIKFQLLKLMLLSILLAMESMVAVKSLRKTRTKT